MASTLAGVPFPDIHQIRRFQSSVTTKVTESDTCTVCFGRFEPSDDVIQIPCQQKHVFHLKCATSWMEKSEQCPLCKTNIVEAVEADQKSLDVCTNTAPPTGGTQQTYSSTQRSSETMAQSAV